MHRLQVKLALLVLLTSSAASAQTVFNCTTFTSSGSPCSVGTSSGYDFWMPGQSGGVANGQAVMIAPDSGHNGYNMNYYTPVNIQAFTSTFTFSPDAQNFVFLVQNNTNTNCCGSINQYFTAGAGGEAGFFQAFATQPATSNRIFAMEFDMDSYQHYDDADYNYSTVQVYQTWQAPLIYNDSGGYYWPTDKISTSPVPMSYPTNTLASAYGPRYTASQSGTTMDVTAIASGTLAVGQQAFPYGAPTTVPQTITACPGGGCNTTGNYTVSASQSISSTTYWGSDVYSAIVTYDGSNFSVCLYDVSAANGSCSSATSGTGTYFQYTWAAVDIPSLVGANTAYVGFSGGINVQPLPGDLISSWSYTVNTPPSLPSLSTYIANNQTFTAGINPPPTPTASPAPGSYSGTQSVTLTSSGSSYICYSTYPSITSTTIFPATDNYGGTSSFASAIGCQQGTLYTGPISVSSTSVIVAQAGYAYNANTGPNGEAAGPPSSQAEFAYTIAGGSASTPTFSPVAGTYTGTQSVTISSSSSGAIICYNTTGSPATNGTTGCTTGTLYSSPVSVASSETLYAVAGGTGYSDSSVGSAAYTINPATIAVSLKGKVSLKGTVKIP